MQIATAAPAPTPASSASSSASIAAPDPSAESPPTPAAAVSVTLSDGALQALAATPGAAVPAAHVQIPPAVLANMAAFETTSPTAYTGQVNQYVDTINDAKASDQDRLDAWTALGRMLTSGTIYQAGNVADLQTALDAEQTSPYAQSLMQLQDQFNTTQVNNLAAARAKGGSGAQSLLDSINSYSAADQQKIFVLFGLNLNYSDLNTMKADYQQVADTYAVTGQLTKATMQLPASSVAAASASDATATASTALPTAASIASGSDVALTLLQNGAAHAAKVAAETNDGAANAATAAAKPSLSSASQPYQQGSALSLVA
jgi:hypothetical protein